MIQRIQTLYLLAAGLVLAIFVGVQAQWASLFAGDRAVFAWVLTGLAVVTALLAFGAVALYKNRSLQRRVVSWAMWADLLLVAGFLAALLARMQAGEATPQGLLLAAMAPVVGYVLLRLGRAGVDRDIATVRSMDRIR